MVTVEPVENDEFLGAATSHTLERYEPAPDGGSVTARHRYGGKGVRYSWRRTVALDDDTIEITDRLTARRPMKCVLLFHLARCRVRRGDDGVVARDSRWKLECESRNASGGILRPIVTRRPAVDDTNNLFKSPEISFKQTGRTVVFKTVLRLGQPGG